MLQPMSLRTQVIERHRVRGNQRSSEPDINFPTCPSAPFDSSVLDEYLAFNHLTPCYDGYARRNDLFRARTVIPAPAPTAC